MTHRKYVADDLYNDFVPLMIKLKLEDPEDLKSTLNELHIQYQVSDGLFSAC